MKTILEWAKQAHVIDRLTTWGGVVLGLVQIAIEAHNIDVAKLAQFDVAEWAKLKTAFATVVIGWFLNKRFGAAAPKQ